MTALFNFSSRTAIVTGAARGIGRSIAEALAASGATVHGFDWQVDTKDVLPFTLHQIDISDSDAVNDLVQSLSPAPTLLVNNAGITRDRSIAKMNDEEWSSVLAVNLTGSFNLLRAVTPGMTAAGYGRIVNITSINGMRGKFGQANYAAAKAGLIGLTKTAARELGRKGVTVNALAPGMVMTDMAKELPQQILDNALDESMTERLAKPEDIAYSVMFLLSEGAAMITGEVLRVDGGQYI
jgi:3-oxoacyl-[acyl-carrier protein] reductase